MTNQEAISVLESINAKTDYFLINDDARTEALDMAIFALRVPDGPDINVGSMISRQAAIDIFDDYNVSVENGELEAYSRNRKRLCNLPPAQPEIIYCKDCKHRGEKPIADGRYWCELHDTFMYYCSDAERRTDD